MNYTILKNVESSTEIEIIGNIKRKTKIVKNLIKYWMYIILTEEYKKAIENKQERLIALFIDVLSIGGSFFSSLRQFYHVPFFKF